MINYTKYNRYDLEKCMYDLGHMDLKNNERLCSNYTFMLLEEYLVRLDLIDEDYQSNVKDGVNL